MKIQKLLLSLMCLLFGTLPDILAQQGSEINRKIEIGIDFVNFNKDWISYNHMLYPDNDKYWSFDFIPSIYIRTPLGNNSIRFKYEPIVKKYSFYNDIDTGENIHGNYTSNSIYIGLEKYLINSRFKAFGALDIGLSVINYKGTYSFLRGWSGQLTINPFRISGFGLSIQPGLGLKYRVFNNFNVIIESSLSLQKTFNNADPRFLFPNNRFIPRPLSLVGFSYVFGQQ